jgi:methylenetetrahydrofolate dehydrogenase (NADP+) / methenyltetrahydrofolate cyclohydrolase
MKLLHGSELAGFIKERHAKDVRRVIGVRGRAPSLAIVLTKDDPVIATYIRLKQRYGKDIGVDVTVHSVEQDQIYSTINDLNNNMSVDGIIVQLPLQDPSQTDKIVQMVAPNKDVDALGDQTYFEPATPMAIMWLLAGYNIELAGKQILLLGRGKLVGAPLEKQLVGSGYSVTVADRGTKNLAQLTKLADIIITATGSPAILYPDMVKQGSVIVDAGVASEDGKTVGDVAEEMYERDDIVITPQKGGVGPLTVCALFENVIRSCKAKPSDKSD